MTDSNMRPSDQSTPSQEPAPGRTLHLGRLTPESVALYIGDASEPVILNVPREATLGRYAPASPIQPTLDLTRFNAYKHGVSRLHAMLHRTDTNEFMISDRASGNGTYLNGKRLEPFTATRLVSGDHVRLAQLEIEILFGPEEIAKGRNVQPKPALTPQDTLPPQVPPSPPDTVPASDLMALVEELTQRAPTHFQGAVAVDPQHLFSQMGLLTEQVLQRLAQMRDTNVQLVLKIDAQAANGFDEATLRWLASICEEFKFSSTTFDIEK